MIQVNEMPVDKDFVMVWRSNGMLCCEAFTNVDGMLLVFNQVEDVYEETDLSNYERIIPTAKFYLTE